ncbi:MAG TPA: cation diffusion facilitator family transporter [Levilinea sp.]|nr:cation diffusion facilitator family transporter [Levilinea sp.]
MNWVRNSTPHENNYPLYRAALLVTVAGNILLAVGKGIAAYLSGSVALYADAANSVSDVLYSLLMALGMWVAIRPPDLSHPQGHSRFEPLVGLGISFSMAIAGLTAAQTSINRLIEGGMAVAPALPAIVMLSAAAVKLGMFFFIRRIAKILSSPTLKTTAVDNLNDVLTSLAAFVGAVGSTYIHVLLDPMAGIIVAAWILRAAYRAAGENFGFLTGAGAGVALRRQIVEIAQEVPGVISVHHTMTEYVGPHLVVDMHVNVDGEKSLNETHAISDEIIHRIEALPEVDRAYVHIEPEGYD